jgi:hypothetical protein
MVVVDLDGKTGRGDCESLERHGDPRVAVPPFRADWRSDPHAQPLRHDVRPGPPRDPLSGHDARRPLLRSRAGHPAAERRSRGGRLRSQHGPRDRRAVRRIWTPWRCRRCWWPVTRRSPGARRRRDSVHNSPSPWRPWPRWPWHVQADRPRRAASGSLRIGQTLSTQAWPSRLLRSEVNRRDGRWRET